MSKYIKWKDLYNALDGAEIRIYDEENAKEIGRVLEDTRQKIINIPTIEVVFCEECKYAPYCEQRLVKEMFGNEIAEWREVDFCQHGERIDNE